MDEAAVPEPLPQTCEEFQDEDMLLLASLLPVASLLNVLVKYSRQYYGPNLRAQSRV